MKANREIKMKNSEEDEVKRTYHRLNNDVAK